jgi:hypothetical protein
MKTGGDFSRLCGLRLIIHPWAQSVLGYGWTGFRAGWRCCLITGVVSYREARIQGMHCILPDNLITSNLGFIPLCDYLYGNCQPMQSSTACNLQYCHLWCTECLQLAMCYHIHIMSWPLNNKPSTRNTQKRRCHTFSWDLPTVHCIAVG